MTFANDNAKDNENERKHADALIAKMYVKLIVECPYILLLLRPSPLSLLCIFTLPPPWQRWRVLASLLLYLLLLLRFLSPRLPEGLFLIGLHVLLHR